MRRGNLPDGGHDKVIWKRSRDQLTRRHEQRNSLLRVSFGTYRRRRRDVQMGNRGYLPLRRLGEVPLRRRWVFYLRLVWDVMETNWWDVVVTSSWDVVTTFQWDVVETYHWDVSVRFTETSLGVLFETYLWRCWDIQRDVVTTLARCLVAGLELDLLTAELFFKLCISQRYLYNLELEKCCFYWC